MSAMSNKSQKESSSETRKEDHFIKRERSMKIGKQYKGQYDDLQSQR